MMKGDNRMKRRLLAGFLAFSMILASLTVTPVLGRAAAGLSCWTENSLVKVLPIQEKTNTSGEEIALDMAKNEYEDAQIVLKSGEAFTIQKVEINDLTGSAGTIPKSDISVE